MRIRVEIHNIIKVGANDVFMPTTQGIGSAGSVRDKADFACQIIMEVNVNSGALIRVAQRVETIAGNVGIVTGPADNDVITAAANPMARTTSRSVKPNCRRLVCTGLLTYGIVAGP